MRLLRQAIEIIRGEMEAARADRMSDDAGQDFLEGLQREILDRLEELQEHARTTLTICGLDLPLHHPIALAILGCVNCHCAVNAQVGIDERPGEYEDAMLDACPEHTRAVNQYAQDERDEEQMREHSTRLYNQLVRHMHGGPRSEHKEEF